MCLWVSAFVKKGGERRQKTLESYSGLFNSVEIPEISYHLGKLCHFLLFPSSFHRVTGYCFQTM